MFACISNMYELHHEKVKGERRLFDGEQMKRVTY